MSQPITPAPAPPPQKKTSPLVWVGIGCGIIVVLGVIAFAIAGWFVKRQVDKFADNPAIAAAELAVRANPELEVVESDAEAGTLTVRNKKTGEVVTWNAEDIESGKFSITTSEGTATFEGATAEQGGTFKVTNEKGEQATFTAGAGASKNLPAWVPVYPGGTAEGSYDATSGGERSAAFTVKTADSIPKVLDFYESRLKTAGFTAEKSTFESNGTVATGTVTGTSADQKRTVNVMVSTADGQTSALVAFTEKP